jgi:hypothetical protein
VRAQPQNACALLIAVAEPEKSSAELKEEVESLRNRLGSDDRRTLKPMFDLIRGYQASDDHKSAIRTGEELLEICKRVLGDEDRQTVYVMALLALSYAESGALDKARILQEPVVPLYERFFGPDSPAVIKMLINLEKILEEQQDYEALEPVQMRLVSACRMTLGDRDEKTLISVVRLATTKRITGSYGSAAELDDLALDGYTDLFGDCHPQTLRVRLAYAMDVGMLGRFSEAGDLLSVLESDAKRALTRNNPLRREIIQATTGLRAMAKKLDSDED